MQESQIFTEKLQDSVEVRKSYVKPEIVTELELETRAGSPIGGLPGSPLDFLPGQ